jgi:hypothetical protein
MNVRYQGLEGVLLERKVRMEGMDKIGWAGGGGGERNGGI